MGKSRKNIDSDYYENIDNESAENENNLIKNMDDFIDYVVDEYGFEYNPENSGADGNTWFYDKKNDVDIMIDKGFIQYCMNSGLLSWNGENNNNYSLVELFEMYNKIPNDIKKEATAFCLDLEYSNDTGMFEPSDGSVHLSPTSLNFPKNGPDNTLFSMVHEFVHAHDYKSSGQWNISDTKKWHDVVDNNKPVTLYADSVKLEEPHKYYHESLAEMGAIYITCKISPNKSVFVDVEGNIVDYSSLDKNSDIYEEIESYYGNLFK